MYITDLDSKHSLDGMMIWNNLGYYNTIWDGTCDFQQCGILTWIDSDKPVQPPFKLRNSKCSSVSSWIFIEYSSDYQRLWSACAYAQAGLSLCWSQIVEISCHSSNIYHAVLHATAPLILIPKESSTLCMVQYLFWVISTAILLFLCMLGNFS